MTDAVDLLNSMERSGLVNAFRPLPSPRRRRSRAGLLSTARALLERLDGLGQGYCESSGSGRQSFGIAASAGATETWGARPGMSVVKTTPIGTP
jgi:hypothetical protein